MTGLVALVALLAAAVVATATSTTAVPATAPRLGALASKVAWLVTFVAYARTHGDACWKKGLSKKQLNGKKNVAQAH